MDEEGWVAYWQELVAKVYVPAWEQLLPLTDSAHLDVLENRLGLALPLSYRAFARVFGPGCVAGAFVIFAPGFPDAPRVDFPGADVWQHLVEQNDERRALLHDLVAFGDWHGHNGIFVWNRREATDSANREYNIYYIPRPFTEPLIPMARSFSALVTEDLMGSGFFPKYGVDLSRVELEWEDEETGEVRTRCCFDPIGSPAPAVA
jgi:hypothetical protein